MSYLIINVRLLSEENIFNIYAENLQIKAANIQEKLKRVISKKEKLEDMQLKMENWNLLKLKA